jgi:hypothetical protein
MSKLFQISVIAVLLLSLASSCASSIKINKEIETSTKQIEIKTVVTKYVIKDSAYYGSITTVNNTADTLMFNFNQRIIIGGETIAADYNIYPISYAHEAFYVLPMSTRTWNVAWKTKAVITDHSKLDLLHDTSVIALQIGRAGF